MLSNLDGQCESRKYAVSNNSNTMQEPCRLRIESTHRRYPEILSTSFWILKASHRFIFLERRSASELLFRKTQVIIVHEDSPKLRSIRKKDILRVVGSKGSSTVCHLSVTLAHFWVRKVGSRVPTTIYSLNYFTFLTDLKIFWEFSKLSFFSFSLFMELLRAVFPSCGRVFKYCIIPTSQCRTTDPCTFPPLRLNSDYSQVLWDTQRFVDLRKALDLTLFLFPA